MDSMESSLEIAIFFTSIKIILIKIDWESVVFSEPQSLAPDIFATQISP